MLHICVYTVIFDRTDCHLPLAADLNSIIRILQLQHGRLSMLTLLIITWIMAIFTELTLWQDMNFDDYLKGNKHIIIYSINKFSMQNRKKMGILTKGVVKLFTNSKCMQWLDYSVLITKTSKSECGQTVSIFRFQIVIKAWKFAFVYFT